MHTTTTFELPGFRVVKVFGVVRGITVRTRSLPMTFLGGLRTVFGVRAQDLAKIVMNGGVVVDDENAPIDGRRGANHDPSPAGRRAARE